MAHRYPITLLWGGVLKLPTLEASLNITQSQTHKTHVKSQDHDAPIGILSCCDGDLNEYCLADLGPLPSLVAHLVTAAHGAVDVVDDRI